MAIKGRLARDLKRLLDGTAAPRPKRARRPAPLVAPAVVLEFTLPYRPANDLNRRSWRGRSRRAKQARDAWWSTIFWAGLWPGTWAKVPLPLAVTLTRIGGRRMDAHDGERAALKPCVDAVASWIGLDDADPSVTWLYGAWEPGPACGVRIRIEAKGG